MVARFWYVLVTLRHTVASVVPGSNVHRKILINIVMCFLYFLSLCTADRFSEVEVAGDCP